MITPRTNIFLFKARAFAKAITRSPLRVYIDISYEYGILIFNPDSAATETGYPNEKRDARWPDSMCHLWKTSGYSVCCRPFWVCLGVLYLCCTTQRESLLSINIKDIFRACHTGEQWLYIVCVSTAKNSGARARGAKAVFIFTSTPLACVYSLGSKELSWCLWLCREGHDDCVTAIFPLAVERDFNDEQTGWRISVALMTKGLHCFLPPVVLTEWACLEIQALPSENSNQESVSAQKDWLRTKFSVFGDPFAGEVFFFWMADPVWLHWFFTASSLNISHWFEGVWVGLCSCVWENLVC